MNLAYTFKPAGPPSSRFIYSDINYLLLGELVHKFSGDLISDYARKNIFVPLGMQDTMFQPPASLVPRIAPTERPTRTDAPLRGVVHDPTSRFMAAWPDTRACSPPPKTSPASPR
jgi:CubicO group peptidase (beta-lactamase class C family)